MKKFEIIEFDRDYRVVTDSYIKEFESHIKAKEYCLNLSWTGYDYYCKEI